MNKDRWLALLNAADRTQLQACAELGVHETTASRWAHAAAVPAHAAAFALLMCMIPDEIERRAIIAELRAFRTERRAVPFDAEVTFRYLGLGSRNALIRIIMLWIAENAPEVKVSRDAAAPRAGPGRPRKSAQPPEQATAATPAPRKPRVNLRQARIAWRKGWKNRKSASRRRGRQRESTKAAEPTDVTAATGD